MRQIIINVLRAYQYFISPLHISSCRFSPTCSHYAVDVITKYGALRGSWLSIKRLIRCNPWNSGGYDPAP